MVGATRYGQRISLLVATLFALVLSIPSVVAAPFDNISKAMGTVWNAIGSLFSFQYVSGSPAIQEGILKFLIFILLLRVVMAVLQKAGEGKNSWLDAKTSGIIGFVVAAVTVIFTPNVFIFSSIILLLVPVLLAVLGFYFVFKGKTDETKTNPWLAAFILFILFLLLSFLQESVYTRGNIAVGKMYPFTQTVMDLLILITIVLFVWKLLAAIFSIGSGSGLSSPLASKIGSALRTGLVDGALGAPDQVDFALEGTDHIKITWGPPSAEDQARLSRYKIEHRYEGQSWNLVDDRQPAGSTALVIGAVKGVPLEVSRKMQVRVSAKAKNNFRGWSMPGLSNLKTPGQKTVNPALAQIDALRNSITQLTTLLVNVTAVVTTPPLALIKHVNGVPVFNKIIQLSTLTPAEQTIVTSRLASAKADLHHILSELANAQNLSASIAPHHATLSPSDLAHVMRLNAAVTRCAAHHRALSVACNRGVTP